MTRMDEHKHITLTIDESFDVRAPYSAQLVMRHSGAASWALRHLPLGVERWERLVTYAEERVRILAEEGLLPGEDWHYELEGDVFVMTMFIRAEDF